VIDKSAPRLADPSTCGENLVDNLKSMLEVAPVRCPGCADYHLANAAIRLLDNAPWKRGSRASLLQTLECVLAELAARNASVVDILIAGAADTATLSTCAHAVWRKGEEFLRRIRFTVLDRCPTPLSLCADFGARHRLSLRTVPIKLNETSDAFQADLVVLHNLLPFIQQDRHAALLQMLGSWLKQDGRMVLWQPASPVSDREADRAIRFKRFAQLKAMIDKRILDVGAKADELSASIERNVDDHRPGQPRFPDTASIIELVRSAKLTVRSLEDFPHNCELRSKHYVMVVAKRSTP
jgi:hypothetical protein